jgi:hypothetical protein
MKPDARRHSPRLRRWVFLAVLVSLSGAIPAFSQTNAPEPKWDVTSVYQERQLEGWTVRVNPKLAADTNLCADVLKLLSAQLFQITRVVPAGPLAKIRQIPIWAELNDPQFPGACYHESPDWLREHGINPDKVNGVELANAANFLTWTKEQPCMVLHELAHGYHHQFLGDDFAGIRRCFAHAQAARLYESVLRINGHHERHYAMTSEKEYFAEMTEAFFGTNDFYPFVRAELQEHDPEMFQLLREVWETR